MCFVDGHIHTMKFLGLAQSSPKSLAVSSSSSTQAPPSSLHHRHHRHHQFPFSFMSVATWFLVTLAAAAIDTPASTPVAPSPVAQQQQQQQDNNVVRSPHIVAQFPAGENGQRYGHFPPLDANATREGALRFNHLTIDPASGRLYAGAINRLFQLDSSLKLEEYVLTGGQYHCLLRSFLPKVRKRKKPRFTSRACVSLTSQAREWTTRSAMQQVARRGT